MASSGYNVITPLNKNIRRLGLPRSKNTKNEPTAVDKTIIPQSDGKIYCRRTKGINLKMKETSESPTQLKNQVQKQPLSTGCRPYSMALSKKVREKMTKRRLEFCSSNEEQNSQRNKKIHPTVNKPFETAQHSVKDLENSCENQFEAEEMSKEQLSSSIVEIQNQLELRRKHTQRVADLKDAIEIWREGFCSALNDLQRKFQPHLSKKQILKELHIQHEMLQNMDD